MSDENFRFLGGKFCEAVFDGVEPFAEDFDVLAAFVGAFAVVDWGQSKAKYEMVFIFKFGVV